MNKKNKGFTLIELLAIIVIIAIIAVIAIPQISNVIEDSKKNSAKDSAYGYKNAVHQFYLTESTSNSDIEMDGNYSIENGKITDGTNTFNIELSGSAPESGEVTIENGEIVDGCINYGKYSVTISNGEISETNNGSCYNISYFTYDENSENNITSKVSKPDSNWLFYIKEMEIQNKYRYEITNKNDNEMFENISFSSLDECQAFLDSKQDEIEISQYECIIAKKDAKYEICGIENNTTFCLKPEESNNEANINTLNNIFEDCSTINNTFNCTGDNISANISQYGVTIIEKNNSKSCEVFSTNYYICEIHPGYK